MKAAHKADHIWTPRGCTRYFDGILHGLGAAI